MPLKTSEDKFIATLNGTKISIAPQEEIKQVLRLIMMKLGLRSHNIPTDEEKFVLISHIIENFGGHTCEEIKLAFELAMAGRLDIKDINCYENFSCAYFSKIMSAYRDWAAEEYKYVRAKRLAEKYLIEEKKEISDEEMQEWVNEWEIKIPSIKNFLLIPYQFYDWLERKEMIDLYVEQKKEYWEKAIILRNNELIEDGEMDKYQAQVLKEFNTMKRQNDFNYRETEKLKVLAKKIAVFDYLKSKSNGN